MAAIDLASDFLVVLRSPDGQRALADAFRGVVGDEFRRVLAEREVDGLVDTAGLAKLVGAPSPRAMRARLARGSRLAALAIVDDTGRKRWRKSEVLRVLEARSNAT